VWERAPDGERQNLKRFHRAAPFWIEDGTGSARVDGQHHVRVRVGREHLREGSVQGTPLVGLLESSYIPTTSWLGWPRDLRYEEEAIHRDAVARVVGFARLELDLQSARPGPRQLPIHPILRDAGEGEPLVIAAGMGETG
jgi:hypothetical protein